MLKRPEGHLWLVRILPLEGALVTLDFGEGVSDFCKLWGPWENDSLGLGFASVWKGSFSHYALHRYKGGLTPFDSFLLWHLVERFC